MRKKQWALQMDYTEKRKHVRIPVRLPVQVHFGGKTFTAEITDISEGGAFVHGAIPIWIGAAVILEIFETPPIEIQEKYRSGIQSVVRWARGCSSSGFGVEFCNGC